MTPMPVTMPTINAECRGINAQFEEEFIPFAVDPGNGITQDRAAKERHGDR